MKGRTIRQILIKAMIFAKKASPYVLAGLSAAGTVMVTVEAVKEIKKNNPEVYYAKPDDLVDTLDEKEENGAVVRICNNKFDILKNKTIDGIKLYWKPIVFGTGSVACLFGSVFIFSKRQKQLIIATYQMQQLLSKYTNAAAATAGVGGSAVLAKTGPENIPEEVKNVDDDGKVLFWDPYFDDGDSKGYYFRATEAAFQDAAKRTMHCFLCNGIDTIENFYIRMDVAPPLDKNLDTYKGWGWIWNDRFIDDWQEYAPNGIYIDCSEPMYMDDGMEYRIVRYDKPPFWDQDIADDPCVKNYLYYNFM